MDFLEDEQQNSHNPLACFRVAGAPSIRSMYEGSEFYNIAINRMIFFFLTEELFLHLNN